MPVVIFSSIPYPGPGKTFSSVVIYKAWNKNYTNRNFFATSGFIPASKKWVAKQRPVVIGLARFSIPGLPAPFLMISEGMDVLEATCLFVMRGA